MNGYIYMHTSPSGMAYIGKSTAAKGKRWNEHIRAAYNSDYKEYNYPLQRAIRKYGEDQFVHDVLEDSIPNELLSELEVMYIEKYDTFYSGYNQTKGGEGTLGERSVEAKIRIATANQERIWTEEMKNNMSQAKSGICMKPWYVVAPHGERELIYTTTKKDYAIQKGWPVGSFKNLFSTRKNTVISSGIFKGYTVGNLEDINE